MIRFGQNETSEVFCRLPDFGSLRGGILREGQGLVEFVIALPFLLLLLVGLVESVALASDYLRLQAVVREGARLGSHLDVPATPAGAAQVRALVRDQLQAQGLTRLNPDQDILVIFAQVDSRRPGRIRRRQDPPVSVTCPAVLTAAEILDRVGRHGGKADLVAVEVCLDHAQVLGFPLVSDFLPNPIRLHLYAVMPRTQP